MRLILARSRWRLSLNDALILNIDGRQRKIPFASVKDARISQCLLWWKKLLIHTDGDEAVFLHGVSRFGALKVRDAIAKRVSRNLLIAIDNLGDLTRRLDEFYAQEKYLANSDVERWRKEHPVAQQLDHALRHPLFDQNVMTADVSYLSVQVEDLLGKRTTLHEHNEEFIKQELIHQVNFFDCVENDPFTKEQRRAAIVMEDHHLLIASAGSGKTAAIVGKIGYALMKNLWSPSQIVALAFNSNAVKELRQRLSERLGDLNGNEVRVNTFHALGLQYISKASDAKPRVAEWAVSLGENPGQKTEELVIELCKANPDFITRLVNLVSCFRWAMKPLHFFHGWKEYELYLLAIRAKRSAGEEGVRTINDEQVRSLQECAIANWLYVNGIQYEYERDYRYNTATRDCGQYRPDFYYPQSDLWHEHFALDEHGTSPDFLGPDYVNGVEWKRQVHQQYGTQLIETTSAMFRQGNVFERLRVELEKYGALNGAVPPSPRKVVERLSEHSTRPMYALMQTFLSHWKSTGATEEELFARLDCFSGFDRFRAEAFLDVMIPLRETYERKLHDRRETDFDDMLTGASAVLWDRSVQHGYKLILVDEFQDISLPRAQMLRAMLSQDPECKLFAVGDDWQAIYRFAGADISVMTNFHDEFGIATKDQLTQTFRSNQGIVNVAAKFVQKNPRQIPKEIRARDALCEGVIHVVYYHLNEHVALTIETKLNEIAASGGSGEKSVYILARYSHLCPAQLNAWKRHYRSRKLDIQFMTMHKSKGLEADYVIVLGMNSGRYSFPCEFEDDPILKLVMPKTDPFEFAEERRLFYVVLTRAKRKVYLLARQDCPSRFIREIIDNQDGSVVLEKTQTTGETAPARICPKCKTGFLIERSGRFGPFMGCSTYPLCSHKQQTSVQERPLS